MVKYECRCVPRGKDLICLCSSKNANSHLYIFSLKFVMFSFTFLLVSRFSCWCRQFKGDPSSDLFRFLLLPHLKVCLSQHDRAAQVRFSLCFLAQQIVWDCTMLLFCFHDLCLENTRAIWEAGKHPGRRCQRAIYVSVTTFLSMKQPGNYDFTRGSRAAREVLFFYLRFCIQTMGFKLWVPWGRSSGYESQIH